MFGEIISVEPNPSLDIVSFEGLFTGCNPLVVNTSISHIELHSWLPNTIDIPSGCGNISTYVTGVYGHFYASLGFHVSSPNKTKIHHLRLQLDLDCKKHSFDDVWDRFESGESFRIWNYFVSCLNLLVAPLLL